MLNVYLQNKISGIHIMNTAVSGNNSKLYENALPKMYLAIQQIKYLFSLGRMI